MTGTAMQRLCPAQNATAMKARISPAMELRCPASKGVANQRWLSKGNAQTRHGRAMVAPTRKGTAAPSKGLAELCGGIALRRAAAAKCGGGTQRRQGADWQGQSVHGLNTAAANQISDARRQGYAVLAMASQRLQGWAMARQDADTQGRSEASYATAVTRQAESAVRGQ